MAMDCTTNPIALKISCTPSSISSVLCSLTNFKVTTIFLTFRDRLLVQMQQFKLECHVCLMCVQANSTCRLGRKWMCGIGIWKKIERATPSAPKLAKLNFSKFGARDAASSKCVHSTALHFAPPVWKLVRSFIGPKQRQQRRHGRRRSSITLMMWVL